MKLPAHPASGGTGHLPSTKKLKSSRIYCPFSTSDIYGSKLFILSKTMSFVFTMVSPSSVKEAQSSRAVEAPSLKHSPFLETRMICENGILKFSLQEPRLDSFETIAICDELASSRSFPSASQRSQKMILNACLICRMKPVSRTYPGLSYTSVIEKNSAYHILARENEES